MHEVGSIVEGKVTGITKFGAFVELPGGSVGMVHISEISQTYVNDISEHLKEQQLVKVKILNIGEDGKISLSIKKALPPAPFVRREGGSRPGGFNNNNSGARPASPRTGTGQGGGGRSEGGFNGSSHYRQAPQTKGPATFEDMLSKFISSSDDKISDMKKTSSNRRGHGKRTPHDYD